MATAGIERSGEFPSQSHKLAAKVLFFGQDSRRCVPLLRLAGYSVDAFDSLVSMQRSVVKERSASAVAMSGLWEPFLHHAISVAGKRTGIPFILFALPNEALAPSAFDLVVPASRRPAEWLAEFDLLVRECRETRARARRTAMASNLLQKQTGRLDLLETPANADPFRDRKPGLVPCGERDRLNLSIIHSMANLTNLLLKMTKVKLDGTAPEQIEALQREADCLVADLGAFLKQWRNHRASHRC